jgi:hypothetical protein
MLAEQVRAGLPALRTLVGPAAVVRTGGEDEDEPSRERRGSRLGSVGRVIASWPTFALLVAVKLLSECSNTGTALTLPSLPAIVPSTSEIVPSSP